jgi:tetratricopeptide (TPR) repeat protein
MAACYLQLGRRDEAQYHLKRAVELDDYSVWAHWALLRMHLEDGDTTMALQARRKIERYNPEMLFYLE